MINFYARFYALEDFTKSIWSTSRKKPTYFNFFSSEIHLHPLKESVQFLVNLRLMKLQNWSYETKGNVNQLREKKLDNWNLWASEVNF